MTAADLTSDSTLDAGRRGGPGHPAGPGGQGLGGPALGFGHRSRGRALGESIAVTVILSALSDGTAWSWSMFNGGETFASKIANNAAEFDSPQKAGAFMAAGLVLFLLTFVVNAIARVVIERRKAFTE